MQNRNFRACRLTLARAQEEVLNRSETLNIGLAEFFTAISTLDSSMEMMESNLLISVIGGLGRWESLENGQQVYCKDDDCLGGPYAFNVPGLLQYSTIDIPTHILFLRRTVTLASFHADCLKDLQRFLRQDDQSTRDCFFTVGRYKSARNDLVPIITTYAGDTDLVYNAREARRACGLECSCSVNVPVAPLTIFCGCSESRHISDHASGSRQRQPWASGLTPSPMPQPHWHTRDSMCTGNVSSRL